MKRLCIGALCALMLTLVLLDTSLALALGQRGRNLVVNPGFEETKNTSATCWNHLGKGYTVVCDGAQAGGVAIMCRSASTNETSGAWQDIEFNPPVQHPFKISGWSKAENVTGSDYCLYMDCWYEDGTNLWGQRIDFEAGTHDWQYIEYIFDVTKPAALIRYFVMLRKCTGKAWFDNVSLTLAPFKIENEEVMPSLYGGNSINYRAKLSIPARWTTSVLRGNREVYQTGGHGCGVAFAWPGTDATGQFLSGGRYRIRLFAKDDILGETLSHETEVHTKSGGGRSYAAWVETSMKRVFIDSLPQALPEKAAASIALAGNEYESFQVALRPAPGHCLKECTVKLSNLKDQAGHVIAKSDIEWHQVGFVRIDEPFRHPEMSRASPGWWPDPLLPVSKFDVPDGVTQSVWFTVYAQPGTPAGQYEGKFVIRSSNAPELSIAVQATVYNFNVPTQPHIKTAFALMDGFLEKIYGKLTPRARRAYGDYVLKHRLNPDDITRTDLPDINDIAYYDNRGLNAFNVLNMVQPRGERPWVCVSPLAVYNPQFKAGLIEKLNPYIAELKHRGLAEKAYIYTFDERGKEFWPVIKEYFGMVKERYDIATFTTAKVPQDPKVMKELNIDWNCPLTSSYNFEQAEECRKASLQVWAYVCLGPRYPYANWLADDPLIEARVLWWQVYHQKMDGFLYWALNYWSRKNNNYVIDPDKDGPRLKWSITAGGKYPLLHGDGVMLYPGKYGPIGSIRLANIRDGVEDYEYLWRLAEVEGSVEKARRACLPVTEKLTIFTRDPCVLYSQRRAIALAIQK